MAVVTNKLVVSSGPLRGAEFPLTATITIGRGIANVVYLDDPAVAERHCTIELREGGLVLNDLDSRTGTFVNGIPVKTRQLQSGDEIAIGSSVFLFADGNSQPAPTANVEIDEAGPLTAQPSEFRVDQPKPLAPEALAALPRSDRLARNLNALTYICGGIGALRDEESLPWQLLSMVLDIIPADRGAILLLDGSHEVRSRAAWDRATGPDQPVHVRRDILDRAVHGQTALLDTGAGAPVCTAKAAPRRSLLCVPLLSNEKVIGLIYLESDGAGTALTEDDFRLLTALASLGSIAIENSRQVELLGTENQRLRAEAALTHDMVGGSSRMREVYQFIERVAPSDSTVLIHGESGTGKELVAGAVHKNSPRRNQPFVALNCAALTETLLESELFGHEKGAFTSAVNQKKGFLEVAEGGTIFLDEIGELSLLLQAKLLRVLQEREFVRVGGTRPIKINVRFVAATNKDLQKSVREEKFRADLFHRLNVISIALPSLRERAEDIPPLAEHFVARHARNCNRRVTGISAEAMTCLAQYDWPGNVRELENSLERAVVIGTSDKILPEDLPDAVADNSRHNTTAPPPGKYHDAIVRLKKQMILNALERSNGSITEAAKQLGVHANYLHRLMRNLELRATQKKRASE